MRFQGNLVFAGQLNVKAAGDGGTVIAACIAVKGNFTLRPEARLSIEGCKNEADKGDAGHGGCLHVDGDAELLGGRLLLRECSARKGRGGGMYVEGRTGISGPAFAALTTIDLETRGLRTLASEEL